MSLHSQTGPLCWKAICIQVVCVDSSVGALMEGKSWQWQGRGEGPSARREMSTMKKLHSVLPKWLSCVQVGRTRKDSTCRRHEVQFGGPSVHHCIPPLSISCPATLAGGRRSLSRISCPSSTVCTFIRNSLPEEYLGRLCPHQYCWWHICHQYKIGQLHPSYRGTWCSPLLLSEALAAATRCWLHSDCPGRWGCQQ